MESKPDRAPSSTTEKTAGRCYAMGVGGFGESDKVRHKCAAERRPVCEQEGAVQCEECRRWFCNRDGLAVHRCRREEMVEDGAAGGLPRTSGV